MIGVVALAHRLGGEVGVGAGAVPVALDRLGVERGRDAEVLGDAVQQPAGDPELVSHSAAATGPTWNSHCPGITSALMPEMWRPA